MIQIGIVRLKHYGTSNKNVKELKNMENDMRQLLETLERLDEKKQYEALRIKSEKMVDMLVQLRKERDKLLELNRERVSLLRSIVEGQTPLPIVVEIMAAALLLLGDDIPLDLMKESGDVKELARVIAPLISDNYDRTSGRLGFRKL